MKNLLAQWRSRARLMVWVALSVGLLVKNVLAESYQYEIYPGVAGNITSVGSDTLANLMTYWSQEFQTLYPHMRFQIQASGSSTAPPALIEGTANIGPMSRELKPSELNAFIQRYGYRPTVLKVAIDAIAIFVDRRNTLAGLTLQQVDAIFSVTRFCGAESSINYWPQLGVNAKRQSKLIKLFGRNSVSGTYGHFKQVALCNGDFRANVNEQPGSVSVVQSIAYSNGAIGYAAFGQKTAGVRAVPIAESGEAFVPVTVDTVTSGQYPLSRYLYIVVNKVPDQALPTNVYEFLKFVLSRQGQELVKRDGYVAVPDDLVERQLKLLMTKE